MGSRGPKARPTALRVLEGNRSRTPLNPNEPQLEGKPICPGHLSQDAKAVWETVMESVPPGMITAVDAPLLAAWCTAWAIHKQASEALAKAVDLLGNNLVVSDRPSPYIKIMDAQAKILASLGTRLGLSPADRSGISVTKPPRSDKWTGLVE